MIFVIFHYKNVYFPIFNMFYVSDTLVVRVQLLNKVLCLDQLCGCSHKSVCVLPAGKLLCDFDRLEF